MRRSLAALACSLLFATGAQAAGEAEDIYKRGSDIGASFLAEHASRLWLALTLEECGERDLAVRVAKSLPKSQQYALAKQELTAPGAEMIAQIARAYVVGYETGVRTEFRRMDDLTKGKICMTAKSGASQ